MSNTVLNEFRALCQVPHPTGHLEQMRSYIINKVQQAGLTAESDPAGNLLVRVPATAGWLDKAQRQGRDSQSVTILQAHIDMVAQANQGKAFDFEHDALQLREENGLLLATDTTLGADNGVGVAAMLALLSPGETEHGPLELLFTVDEESGMAGVRQMQPGWLTGQEMLNLDAEQEGTLMLGCAGAVDIKASYRYKLDTAVPEGDKAVLLTLSGLRGGHSGMDIHLGRGNACKLMVRFLKHAVVNFEARLSSLSGGGVRNAIPREATALVTVPSEVLDELLDEVAYYSELYSYELRGIDADVTLTAQVVDAPQSLLPEEVQDDILNSLEAAPDGLFRYSPDLPQVVETSSNLATILTVAEGEFGHCDVVFLVRSLNEEMKRALSSRIQSCFILSGARVDFSAAYSGWEQSPQSPLPQRVCAAYRALFQQDMVLNSVHCGLECGILHDLYPDLSIVSLGPTIHHPHSPQESVEVESIGRFWQLLCEII